MTGAISTKEYSVSDDMKTTDVPDFDTGDSEP